MTQHQKIWGVFLVLAVVLISSGRAEAKFNVGAGFLYMFQNGDDNHNLDPGPGGRVFAGWEGKIFGIRGDFFYAAMQREFNHPTEGENADLFGGTLDFKVKPIGMIDIPVQPYAVIGFGGMKGDGVAGGLGDVGVGLDILLGEHFSIGVEGNWNPLIYPGDAWFDDCFNNCGSNDDWDVSHFFSTSINAAVHF